MLISGKWQDEQGAKYYIPAYTDDEGTLIKEAQAQAAEKEKSVVTVWACYVNERRLKL